MSGSILFISGSNQVSKALSLALTLALTALSMVSVSCAPKDEKLKTKSNYRQGSGRAGEQSRGPGLPLVERTPDLSRVLVLQVAQARLYMESALNAKIKTRTGLKPGASTPLSDAGCVSLTKIAPETQPLKPAKIEKFNLNYFKCQDDPPAGEMSVRGTLHGEERYVISYREDYPAEDSSTDVPGYPETIEVTTEVLDLTVGLPFITNSKKVVVDRENNANVMRSVVFSAWKIAEDPTSITYSASLHTTDFYSLKSKAIGSGAMVGSLPKLVFKVEKNDARRVVAMRVGTMSYSVKGWTQDMRIKTRDNPAGRFQLRFEAEANDSVIFLPRDYCQVPGFVARGLVSKNSLMKSPLPLQIDVAGGSLEITVAEAKESRPLSLCDDVGIPRFREALGQIFF